jgi:type II secretory pathway component PulF
MIPLLAMIDSVPGLLKLVGSALLYLLLFLTPVAFISLLAHTLLSLPLKRRERARLFLDLVDTALSQGRPLEPTLVSIAQCRDRAPGIHFHLLAAHLEKGLRLGAALEAVPQLLPPQIAAMLKAGERIGDLRKVLPACRQVLNDSVSQVRGALNYLLVVAFILTPFTILVPLMLSVMVIPKFKAIFASMGGSALPPFTLFVFDHIRTLCLVQSGVLCLVWIAALAYVGGPRLRQGARRFLPGVPDGLMFLLSWRRKRLQRDFSTLLAVLLDSEVPEAEAVALAAEATANSVMRRRAARVCELLDSGVKLPEAIRVLDRSGELHWRLANALRRGRDFLRALAGWNEALDARAFQLEQSAAQITTSALVVFNGIVVACVVIAVFMALTNLISEATLW